jgi:hypothetical protein
MVRRISRALVLTRATAIAGLLLVGACHDQTITTPAATPPVQASRVPVAKCTVVVATRVLTCASLSSSAKKPAGVHADRIVGGQDLYVKLASANTSYDGGTELLSTDVTLQNLAQFSMGTTDGATMSPISIFFDASPAVTSGTGVVTVANPDGTGTFTGASQPYFSYAQILAPYVISTARQWQFSVPATVNTFEFYVYVSAPMTDLIGTLLDRVWAGTTSSDWFADANWRDGAAPVATSTITVLADSLLPAGHQQPTLTADDTVAHVRVGYGSSLTLNGHRLTVTGNVDAVGPILNGTLALPGTGTLIGGTVDAVVVNGSVSLQRSVVATSAVSVMDGALAVADKAFSIQIP